MKGKTIIKLILVIAWMSVIFAFSHQPAEESSDLSDRMIVRITEKVRHKELTDKEKEEVVEKFTVLIRKTAHFIEYLILGILVYITILDFDKYKAKAFTYAILICCFYACTDEIHQIFIPGRAGRVLDTIIDTLGSTVGVYIYSLINKTKKKTK